MVRLRLWAKKLSKKRMIVFFFSILFLFYLLPTFVQVRFDNDLRIDEFYLGLPGVISGDEPHYFVTTTSLINDHDYYIDNNYDNAYFYGGCDVSFRYVNNTNPTLWRHIQIVAPEQRMAFPINISEMHGNDLDEFYKELVVRLQKEYNITVARQVSNRPIGLPLLSALFLWPFKNTCFIENGAIYLSVAISFIGLIFFFLTCLFYLKLYRKIDDEKEKETYENENLWIALSFTAILALCTQYWHYSKTYFTEPYLAAFLLAAYYLFVIKKQSFMPGLLLSIGFSMKYPFGMYLGIFGMFILWKREWKRIVPFMFGASGPIIVVSYYSWLLSGHLFSSAQSGHLFFGNYLQGIVFWLLDPTFGLLPFAPFLMFSVLGLQWLWSADRKTFITIISVIMPYLFFWTSYTLTQTGAGGYSARYLIPLIAFLVLLSLFWYQQNKNKMLCCIFFALVALSFIINIQAAFLYPLFWNNPPWIVLEFLRYKWIRVLELWNKF